jgi:peptide/nickel transport system permease protein
MINYIIRRTLIAIPTLLVIAVLGFILMELPPGDYVTRYVGQLQASGRSDSLRMAEELRARYKLDDPAAVRFVDWITHFAKGDFGESFQQQRPVREIIGRRLGMTIALAMCSFLLSWGIGIPLGIYSATHQYSWQDNLFTILAFVGLGLPAFLIALLLLVVGFNLTGQVLTGLISPEYVNQPWSPAKFADLLKHLWIPVMAVVVTGTAWVVRVMRGNLLDELRVNYVQAARARGLSENTVIMKHAVRNAMHPLVMALGGVLAWMIGGSPIVEQVLDLPTIGPVYITATQNQDIYLAGTILILFSFLLVLGNLLADIALAWLDPRIRYD